MKEIKWVEREKCDGAIYDILCHEFRFLFRAPRASSHEVASEFRRGPFPTARRLQKLLTVRGVEWTLRCQSRQLERPQ